MWWTALLVLNALAAVKGYPAPEGQLDGYRGHQVMAIQVGSSNELDKLKHFLSQLQLDIWRLPKVTNETLDVRVTPDLVDTVVTTMHNMGLQYSTLVSDLGKMIEDQAHQSRLRRKRSTADLYSDTQRYLSYNEIMSFLDRVANSPTKTVTAEVSTIGHSFENRAIKVIKLSRGSDANKPAILIDAGIHAREWVAPATAINIIFKLAMNPTNDPAVTDLVDKFTWYVIPIVNPDGYEYSRLSPNTRLWRKTRSWGSRSHCRGVDGNRNFGFHWDPYSGGSTNPCDEVYAGSTPLSEPETQALATFMRDHKAQIKAYLTYHSYGQYFLYPWGYAPVIPADKSEMEDLATKSSRAMRRRYKIGSSALLLYSAAGGSDDYAKGAMGIKYSYTIELPPDDDNFDTSVGFILAESAMPAVAGDAFNGVQAFAETLYAKLHDTQGQGPSAAATPTPWWAALFGR